MLDLQMEMAREFVENLEVEVAGSGRLWRPLGDAAFAEQRCKAPGAFVVAASVVAFTDGLSQQQREDVLNSTLLAQLAANLRYERERDTIDWYAYYRTVLHQVGWRGGSRRPVPRHPETQFAPTLKILPNLPLLPVKAPDLAFTRVVPKRAWFNAEATVMGLLRPRVQDDALAATSAALEKLASLDDRDRRNVIFETSAHKAGRGSFQIVSVHADKNGVVQMTIAALFFTTGETVTRVLSYNFGKNNTQMCQACDTLDLDGGIYDSVRDKVIAQLGDQASVYIDELIAS